MSLLGTVIPLTRETLSVFLSIFGDLPHGAPFRGRRDDIRRPSRIPIEFLRTRPSGDAEMCYGHCVDISEGGVGFVCRDALRVGELIEVFLKGESQEYSVRAQVVHCAATADRHRIGAQFVWPAQV